MVQDGVEHADWAERLRRDETSVSAWRMGVSRCPLDDTNLLCAKWLFF